MSTDNSVGSPVRIRFTGEIIFNKISLLITALQRVVLFTASFIKSPKSWDSQ